MIPVELKQTRLAADQLLDRCYGAFIRDTCFHLELQERVCGGDGKSRWTHMLHVCAAAQLQSFPAWDDTSGDEAHLSDIPVDVFSAKCALLGSIINHRQ